MVVLSSLLLGCYISFIVVLLMGNRYIDFLKKSRLTGIDMHKKGKKEVAEMGGPLVLFGIIFGLYSYIGITTFYYHQQNEMTPLLAAISTILIISFIGIIDDFAVLTGRMNGKRIGLRQWQKPLLTLPAAIPLMAIMAGTPSITIPFFGNVYLGAIYSLVLVPIGIMGASNAMNMLAGFNGLEAGSGVVLLSFLSYYAYINGGQIAALIGLVSISALLAFLIFNWYPAKIFPGDSLTYTIGAIVAIVAILGNIEKFAIFCFAPWFIELILKIRSRFKAENFGKLQKDGTLKAPYKKCYSLTHCIMKLGRFKEWQVSTILIFASVIWNTIVLLAIV